MSVGTHFKSRRRDASLFVQVGEESLKPWRELAKLSPKALQAAQRRAINKTLGWLRTHVSRAVSREEQIAVRAVRERLRIRGAKGAAAKGELWFGINALPASKTGRPRQTAAGVTVGKRSYRGAFYRRVYGADPDIWIRTHSPHFRAQNYPDLQRSGGNLDGSMVGRFPVAKAKISLEGVRPHFQRWVAQAEQRLLELLRQEATYELHKIMGNAR